MQRTVLLFFLCANLGFAQLAKIPSYYAIHHQRSSELQNLVRELQLAGDFDVGEDGQEQISLAVIDLSGKRPRLSGVNMENFIYPASVYKMYVAAEVLNQISRGETFLETTLIVKFPNVVDHAKEILSDPRPLLQEGDTVTVNYLLDLMITRSDNSAANCLIDLARRENINRFMHDNNWQGSEVTRKFLRRKYEDAGYEQIRGSETCALHAADFMYRIYANQLTNPWVSQQLKVLLGRQLDNTKLAAGLPAEAMFYHKTGWFSYWTHDVGIVDDGHKRYIVACFLPLAEEVAIKKFPELAERIHELMGR